MALYQVHSLIDVMIAQLFENLAPSKSNESSTTSSSTDSSVGSFVGPFGARKSCWQARGTFRDIFEDQIIPEIIAVLNSHFAYVPGTEHCTLSLYMVGKGEQTAKPTVLFISRNEQCRKRIRDILKESGVLHRYPDFSTAFVGRDPGSLNIMNLTSGISTEYPTLAIEHAQEVLFDQSASLSPLGLRVFVKHVTSLRPATANAVWVEDRLFLQTVSHAFYKDTVIAEDSLVPTAHDSVIDTESEPDSEASHDEAPDTVRPTITTYAPNEIAVVKPEELADANLSEIGRLFKVSDKRDLALIEITNTEIEEKLKSIIKGDNLKLAFDHIVECPKDDAQVFTHTASGGKLCGILSGTASYTRLANRTSFQKMYVARLRGALAPGDCGSAIMDENTRDTYGYLVAGCQTTGVAYILAADAAGETCKESSTTTNLNRMTTMDDLVRLLASSSVAESSTIVQECSVLTNPVDVWRWELTVLLAKMTGREMRDVYKCIQWPNNMDNGDLAVALPKLCPGCKVDEQATEVMGKVRYCQQLCHSGDTANHSKQFPQDSPLFLLPFRDGVHLRIFVKPDILPRLLVPYIINRAQVYGQGPAPSEAPKKLVIECSSPNITAEFQGKHLRSTIIGAFISRLYESFGWDVKRINYLGDWGKPIALLYVGWTKFGSKEAYDADPVGHLLEIYHKIDVLFQPEQAASRQARDDAAKEGKYEGEAQAETESKGIFAERNEAFRALEEGKEDIKVFWSKVRKVIVEDYVGFYERLGTHFDEYTGESQASAEKMVEVEQMLKDRNIVEESAGAWMVDMTKLGARAGHAIIRDRTGSSTYLLRDLAAVLERSTKYSFDKMIYVVANDNSIHFAQMFKILEALDKHLADKLQHVKFSEMSKMMATLGKGYKPRAILDKCEESFRTLEEADADKSALLGNSEQARKALAASSLLVQELSTRFATVHAFDTKSVATFKLGSGPDIQYWHAKISSLLSGRNVTAGLSDKDFDEIADQDDQTNLLRLLAQYPEVVKATYHSLESSGIVAYLASVTEQLSDCLDEEEGEIEVTPSLAVLLQTTRIVLTNGMRLLGFNPVHDLPYVQAHPVHAG